MINRVFLTFLAINALLLGAPRANEALLNYCLIEEEIQCQIFNDWRFSYLEASLSSGSSLESLESFIKNDFNKTVPGSIELYVAFKKTNFNKRDKSQTDPDYRLKSLSALSDILNLTTKDQPELGTYSLDHFPYKNENFSILGPNDYLRKKIFSYGGEVTFRAASKDLGVYLDYLKKQKERILTQAKPFMLRCEQLKSLILLSKEIKKCPKTN